MGLVNSLSLNPLKSVLNMFSLVRILSTGVAVLSGGVNGKVESNITDAEATAHFESLKEYVDVKGNFTHYNATYRDGQFRGQCIYKKGEEAFSFKLPAVSNAFKEIADCKSSCLTNRMCNAWAFDMMWLSDDGGSNCFHYGKDKHSAGDNKYGWVCELAPSCDDIKDKATCEARKEICEFDGGKCKTSYQYLYYFIRIPLAVLGLMTLVCVPLFFWRCVTQKGEERRLAMLYPQKSAEHTVKEEKAFERILHETDKKRMKRDVNLMKARMEYERQKEKVHGNVRKLHSDEKNVIPDKMLVRNLRRDSKTIKRKKESEVPPIRIEEIKPEVHNKVEMTVAQPEQKKARKSKSTGRSKKKAEPAKG